MSCLYIEAQGYVPVLLENLRGMSFSGTCWPLGGAWFSVGMEAFDELINVSWSQAGVLWCSQDLDLSLLPLVFSRILTVASRLLHLCSTIVKTSRLNMKSFSTVRGHPERFTELHGEEKRDEGDRGDQEEKKGNQKRREQASQ